MHCKTKWPPPWQEAWIAENLGKMWPKYPVIIYYIKNQWIHMIVHRPDSHCWECMAVATHQRIKICLCWQSGKWIVARTKTNVICVAPVSRITRPHDITYFPTTFFLNRAVFSDQYINENYRNTTSFCFDFNSPDSRKTYWVAALQY